MKPWPGLWLGCAWLAACSEAPHEGVKLMPRAEPAAALATPGPAPAPASAVLATRAVGAGSPGPAAASTVPAVAPPGPAAPWPGPPATLHGDAVPPLVMPGEPTGNDDFRQALREKLERRAANP